MYTAWLLALQTETGLHQTIPKCIYSLMDVAVSSEAKTAGKTQR
jgi:hypothetical protein